MRPRLAAALRNPISATGEALTTASAFLFLILHALHLLGFLQNPYVGILVFVLLPALFVVGLLIIPIGLGFERRRTRAGIVAPPWPKIDFNDLAQRRALLLVAVLTSANLGILSMASYGAVEYSESQQFCGQACHAVMQPEFVARHWSQECELCHAIE